MAPVPSRMVGAGGPGPSSSRDAASSSSSRGAGTSARPPGGKQKLTKDEQLAARMAKIRQQAAAAGQTAESIAAAKDKYEDSYHVKALYESTLQTHERLLLYLRVFLDESRPGLADERLRLRAPPLTMGDWKAFVEWKVDATKQNGRLKDNSLRLATVVGSIGATISAYQRLTGNILDDNTRSQIGHFIRSELKTTFNLHTAGHTKHTASPEDYRRLIDASYSPVCNWRCARERLQFVLLLMILTFGVGRPGEMVVSSGYGFRADGLQWQDTKVYAIAPPGSDTIVIEIVIIFRLLKGKAADESSSKSFTLRQSDTLSQDPTIPLLALAFEDDVLEYASTPEQLYAINPDTVRQKFGGKMRIPIKPSARNKFVLRYIDKDISGNWVSDPSRVWTYSQADMCLKQMGRVAKFVEELKFYQFRRMAIDLVNNTSVTKADAKAVAGHNQSSTVAENAYYSKLTSVDMQGRVLGEEVRKDAAQYQRGLTYFEDLPQHLSRDGYISVDSAPELVAIRDETARLLKIVRATYPTMSAAKEADAPCYRAYHKSASDMYNLRAALVRDAYRAEVSCSVDTVIEEIMAGVSADASDHPSTTVDHEQPTPALAPSSADTSPSFTEMLLTPDNALAPVDLLASTTATAYPPAFDTTLDSPSSVPLTLNDVVELAPGLDKSQPMDLDVGTNQQPFPAPWADSVLDPALLDDMPMMPTFAQPQAVAPQASSSSMTLPPPAASDSHTSSSAQPRTIVANAPTSQDHPADPRVAALRSRLSAIQLPYTIPKTSAESLLEHLYGDKVATRPELCTMMRTASTDGRTTWAYPGQSATDDHKCPVCNKDWSHTQQQHPGSIAKHLHSCYLGVVGKAVMDAFYEIADLAKCPWSNCNRTEFSSGLEYANHMHGHTSNVRCLMSVHGQVCGASVPSAQASAHHFEMCHGIIGTASKDRAYASTSVDYCVTCHQWLIGRHAIVEHRTSHLVSIVDSMAEDPTALGFDTATATSSRNLALYCPMCLTDDSLEPHMRAKPIDTRQNQIFHINGHLLASSPGVPLHCPYATCADVSLVPVAMADHFITHHAFRLAGRAIVGSQSQLCAGDIHRLKKTPGQKRRFPDPTAAPPPPKKKAKPNNFAPGSAEWLKDRKKFELHHLCTANNIPHPNKNAKNADLITRIQAAASKDPSFSFSLGQ